ncbi:MAG: acyltransferase family protein [Anaerolineae bacterium]|nr:acyltransferase family protein [Anaerolineae bacterium]
MSTQTDIRNQPVPQTRAAVVTRSAVRLNYLDSLRAILISLVIALHTAIAYGAIGDWTYIDPAKSEIAGILLTFVTTIVQAFSLGLYFFIAGYFTPGSYDRKGVWYFWKDRLLRLGIPMLAYTFALSRIPTYIAGRAEGQVTDSFLSYFGRTFITGADEGPTWFIFALLLFVVGYTLWRLATLPIPAEKLAWTRRLKVPGKAAILGFGVLVGVLMFVVGLKTKIGETIEAFGIFNLMTIFFVQYILCFIAGTLAYRNDWLARFNGKDLVFWARMTLALFLMMPVIFFLGGTESPDVFTGGPYWQSAAFMLWIGLFSVSISMTLMLWLRGSTAPQSRFMAFAGANSYAVYLIHPLILIPLTVALTPVALSPLLKFAIVLPVVVGLCFLVAEGLRRIPGVKAIL